MKEQTFVIRAGDYGHIFYFYLTKPDGKVFVLPGSPTLTFECYIEGGSSFFVEDSIHTAVEDEPKALVKYTVQATDFPAGSSGTYWCRMKVNNITASHDVKLIVLGEYEEGS